MTGKLRVVHIVQNLNYGGMERLLFEMLRRMDRERFESHVLNLQFVGRFGEGLGEFAHVHVARPMSRFSLLRPASLADSIRELAPDVVHTHSGVWYKASLAARMAGVPWLVHTEHGRAFPDPWLARTLDGAAARRTNVIVAVSATVAEQLSAGVTKLASRIRVVPNGVDVDLFLPQVDDGSLREELGLSRTVPIIGSIGRLELVKGFDVMVAAFALLRRSWTAGEAPVLVIAGDGSQRDALMADAAAAGVADAVHWLGWRNDIHRLHAAFDLFTMSSRSEGTSISLLEAMSAGLCPVVTDVGGNAAVLGSTLRQRLVPSEDVAALSMAWRDALLDRVGLERDGRAARARVLEAFTLDTMVRAYERIYQRERSTPRVEAITMKRAPTT
ncbi:MAG TPA: glycosyltransferase [Gemmatimonadaceae bacterium]|nr:glycosyltransferase [Gemmatimonadaceae bacterium]